MIILHKKGEGNGGKTAVAQLEDPWSEKAVFHPVGRFRVRWHLPGIGPHESNPVPVTSQNRMLPATVPGFDQIENQVVLGLYSCCCTEAHLACSWETSDSILSAKRAWGSGALAYGAAFPR